MTQEIRAPEAVLFDMDGVVTDTARAHAAAWQRLFDGYLQQRAAAQGGEWTPFDPQRDYRLHVDGKPRMDGVRDFLASRGIELPWGDPADGPDTETICGLGNRKDRYFNEWLTENAVRSFPGTLRLIDALRRADVPVAVFSASRNAESVLRNAGALDLFEVIVDGNDLATLGLPGKPDPAMLLEAASRLGATPARTAVVEDAVAGVEAGARGGFGLVIGVARGEYDEELRAAGAQLVVHDLSELRYVPGEGLALKAFATLPTVWEREADIRRQLAGRRLVVLLDYDGTLTPIVVDHTRALLSADMRAAIDRLSQHVPVAIISGRDLDRLQQLVGLDSVWAAGSHGFDVTGPAGSGERLERGTEFLAELDQVERRLRADLAAIEGHSLERKRFSIAVHYRRVAEQDIGKVRLAVDQVLEDHPRLRRGSGKKVFEIRPDVDWHKGEAVRWILERLDGAGTNTVPVYVGDDVTDEDAFQALAGRGLCIAVRHDETRQTAADYAVADTAEVKRLLEMLAAIVADSDQTQGARS